MKRIEAWGAELAMALRRESDAYADLQVAEKHLAEVRQAREALERRILTASADELYLNTAEYENLPSRRNAETEVIQLDQDQRCPGADCRWYRDSRAHVHRGGEVYAARIPGITDVTWES